MPWSSGNSPTVRVGLREEPRARGVGAVGGELRREPRGELRHAAGLVAVRAQLRVKGHAVEGRDAGVEARAAVLLHEEGRVGEARAHHALVALANGVRVLRGVHHREKHREQPVRRGCVRVAVRAVRRVTVVAVPGAVGAERRTPTGDGEVPLVPAHHALDERVGEREVLLFEASDDGVGLLDEAEHFAFEKAVAHELAALGRRGGFEAREHRHAARVGVDAHEGHAERGDVLLGAAQRNLRGREEAVPAGDGPGVNPRELEGHHLRVVEGHDPLDGAAEGGLLRRPAHALREGDAAAHRREHRREQRRGVAPRVADHRAHVASLRGVGDGEVRGEHPVLLRESLGGLAPLAVGGAGRRLGGPEHLLLAGLDLGHHRRDEHGEASRRAEHAHEPVGDAGLRELLGDERAKLVERAVEKRRREFFATDFEQKRGRGHGVGPAHLPDAPPRWKPSRARAPRRRRSRAASSRRHEHPRRTVVLRSA